MKIQDKEISKLKELGYDIIFYDSYYNNASKKDAVEYTVYSLDPYKIHSFKCKKSEHTAEYILNRIAKIENYTSIDWNKVFEPLNLHNVGFYTTSYGLGVEVMFSRRDETIKAIETFLNEKGIEYTNEYSEAHWVYRFKISKKTENINKINNLIN